MVVSRAQDLKTVHCVSQSPSGAQTVYITAIIALTGVIKIKGVQQGVIMDTFKITIQAKAVWSVISVLIHVTLAQVLIMMSVPLVKWDTGA